MRDPEPTASGVEPQVEPPKMCSNLRPPFPTARQIERWLHGQAARPQANHCPNLATAQIGFLVSDAEITESAWPTMPYCADCIAPLKGMPELRVYPLDFVPTRPDFRPIGRP